jgi:YHS domain-containing protein
MLGKSRLSPSKWICITTSLVAMTTAGVASAQDAPVATAPPFTPAPINGTLVDFVTGLPVSHTMQVMAKPLLLRPGFAGEAVNTAKGLAAKIKAKEVDVPKRVKAAKYLGKVDCQAFPDSQDQLLDLVVNDEFEEVRLAAAKAFKEQFSKGCNPNPSKKKQRRFDTCRGCCNRVEILNKLAERAYECDDTGCAKEPSPRVREAIVDALNCCCCWQSYGSGNYQGPLELNPPPTPDAAPPADATKEKPPVVPPEAAEAALRGKTNAIPAAHFNDGAQKSELQSVAMEKNLLDPDAPLVDCLRGNCPVGIAARRLEPASPEIWTSYKGHRYEFASENAKEQFLENPEHFAPVLCGHCIVTFTKTGEKVIGSYCREHDGRQYWFASKELRDEFKADPDGFVDAMDDEPVSASSSCFSTNSLLR